MTGAQCLPHQRSLLVQTLPRPCAQEPGGADQSRGLQGKLAQTTRGVALATRPAVPLPSMAPPSWLGLSYGPESVWNVPPLPVGTPAACGPTPQKSLVSSHWQTVAPSPCPLTSPVLPHRHQAFVRPSPGYRGPRRPPSHDPGSAPGLST